MGWCPLRGARKLCAAFSTHAVTCSSVLIKLNLCSNQTTGEVTTTLHAIGLASVSCSSFIRLLGDADWLMV